MLRVVVTLLGQPSASTMYSMAEGPGFERAPPSNLTTVGVVISTLHLCYPACCSTDTWNSGSRFASSFPLIGSYDNRAVGMTRGIENH